MEEDMTPTWKLRAQWALLLGAAGVLPGCVAAAAAGAGTGIYLTTRGAESVVNGSVGDVAARARTVMGDMGITISETTMKDSGDKRELKGKKDDLDVTISMERAGDATTKTEVTARKNLVEWDKDYAQQILNRIVKSS
jgi:hypothetical protein